MVVKPTGLLIRLLCLLSPQTLDVRLGFSLCAAELEFLQKRKVVAAQALKQVLQLEEDLHVDEVGKQRTSSLGVSPPLSRACPSDTTSCQPPPSPTLSLGDLATTFPGCPAEGRAGCDSIVGLQG